MVILWSLRVTWGSSKDKQKSFWTEFMIDFGHLPDTFLVDPWSMFKYVQNLRDTAMPRSRGVGGGFQESSHVWCSAPLGNGFLAVFKLSNFTTPHEMNENKFCMFENDLPWSRTNQANWTMKLLLMGNRPKLKLRARGCRLVRCGGCRLVRRPCGM